jgi:aspartyl-tRNA(Asn)/glutamyl-tRNA(Gln) amidotransferase subunit A
MTRTVNDAALMLTAMTGFDPRDPYALPHDARDWSLGIAAGVEGLRVAYAPTLSAAFVDPRIAALVRDAVADLADLCAIVGEAEPPLADAVESHKVLYRVAIGSLVGAMPAKTRVLLDPGLLAFAAEAKSIGLADYLAALQARERLIAALNSFFQTYDLLATPSLPIVAFAASELVPPGSAYADWFEWTPFSSPFNFTKVPAASIPCGMVDGLPVGLQIVAGLYREDLVLRACRAFEDVRPIKPPKP